MVSSNLIVGTRRLEIDGLRALAIMLVMWWHSSIWAYEISANPLNDLFIDAYVLISILGSSGVTLFFIISGFLITGILIDTSSDPQCLRKFYIRRSLRVFPLYYVALCLFLILSIIYIDEYEISFDSLAYFLYVQNWIAIFDFSYNPIGDDKNEFLEHFWSLAIEEQFYLVWPVFFLFMYKKFNSATIILSLLSIIFFSALLRFNMVYMEGVSWAIPYTWTITRFDSLVMGGLLIYAVKKKYKIIDIIKKYSHMLMGLLLFSAIIILFRNEIFIVNVSYIVFLSGLFYVLLIIHLSGKSELSNRLFNNRLVQNIAKVSYGLYIFHLPVMRILQDFLMPYELGFWSNHFIILFFGFFISFVISQLSYKYFENPILKLKGKYAGYAKSTTAKYR